MERKIREKKEVLINNDKKLFSNENLYCCSPITPLDCHLGEFKTFATVNFFTNIGNLVLREIYVRKRRRIIKDS
jgi:hypothetical protein